MRLAGFLQARISAHMGAIKNVNLQVKQHALFAEVETHRSYMLLFATAKSCDAERAEEIVLVGT